MTIHIYEKDTDDTELSDTKTLYFGNIQKFSNPVSGVIEKIKAAEIINKYKKEYKLTYSEAIHSLTYWTQSGGCIKSVPSTKKDINSKGRKEELDVLRRIIKEVEKKGTVRQLARAYLNPIAVCAIHFEYSGPLSKQFKIMDELLTPEELVFANEIFIGYDACPDKIYKLLLERNKKKFDIK